MNEQWMFASYATAKHCRETSCDRIRSLNRFEYLDIMGLFETGWMVFDHKRGGHDFGYPR